MAKKSFQSQLPVVTACLSPGNDCISPSSRSPLSCLEDFAPYKAVLRRGCLMGPRVCVASAPELVKGSGHYGNE